MKNKLLALFFAVTPLIASSVVELKQELGISSKSTTFKEQYCNLYLVHHGDTDWTVEDRLQGWADIPLNETGRMQMKVTAQQLAAINFSIIYSSTLIRSAESAQIISQGHKCMIVFDSALRGENHGIFEGLKKEQYEGHHHFLKYQSLSSEEKLFFPVGEEGESKADIARRAIPALQKICRDHRGQTVVVVTHGGVLKFINFLLGNYTAAEIGSVEHGQLLHLFGDGSTLFYIDDHET